MGRTKKNHPIEFIRERNRRYQKAAIAKRREAGTCLRCGNAALIARANDRICLSCWYRCMAKDATGSMTNAEMVQEILTEQSGLCAYTGERLIPGTNASLDHKTPRSKGGTNERANLQWITKRINLMKGDMDHDEFVFTCQQIGLRLHASTSPAAECVA